MPLVSCRRGSGWQESVAGLRVHDPDDIESGVDDCLAADGILAAMRELRAAGKIKAIGLGMNAVRLRLYTSILAVMRTWRDLRPCAPVCSHMEARTRCH